MEERRAAAGSFSPAIMPVRHDRVQSMLETGQALHRTDALYRHGQIDIRSFGVSPFLGKLRC
jgi:hypothetical protein